ncbi:MAG: sugar phosphate isomerase/epimerase [Crocinitomicaceae bacterium]|jgi:sugar phosphate isomerase/epimerase
MNHLNRRDFTKGLLSSCLASLACGHAMAEEGEHAKELFTEFGVCTSLDKFTTKFQYAGYDYAEETTSGLLMPSKSDEKFAVMLKKLNESKVRVKACNSFMPGSLRSVGKDVNHEGVLNRADTVFKRAKLAGVEGIVFGSSGSRRLKEGDKREDAEKQFVELLKKMAPLAHAQGIEIWLEPLNRKEDNFINTQVEGAAIIEKVNHPALGMVCDIFHVARNEEPPEDIMKTVNFVRHCHIAEKKKRSAPGTEQYDFTPYLKALHKAKYSGSVSMECGWDNLDTRPASALKYLKNQVASMKSK